MVDGRVLVIGLDGVPWNLVREWAAEGVLPTLASLMARGTAGGLGSTIPPTSAPSWSSFITGMNPGKTGIFDFLYRRPDTYQFPPVNTARRQGRPLWCLLNDAGGKVGVVNIPMSYPVDKVDGFMISGWMTPYAATDYLHPAPLAEELRRVAGEYRIYPTTTFKERNREAFFKSTYDLMQLRTKVNLHLIQKPWDFFMTVYFDTDRVLHQLWHYLDPDHPWRKKGDRRDLSGEVKAYFRELDRCLGQIVAAAGENTRIVVMSDHGMGAAYRFVVLNNWLLDEKFIALQGGPVTLLKKALFGMGFNLRNIHILVDKLGLAATAEYKANYFVDHLIKRIFLSFNDVDWSRTKAYSSGRMLGSIYLNVKGREPQGIVERGAEYDRVRQEIVEALDGLRDPQTGRRLIGRVALREDIWHGPRLDEAPDIVAWPADPTDIVFGLSDFGSDRLVDTVYRYSGMHRDEGMVIAAGPGIKAGAALDKPWIADLPATVLHMLGAPVPGDMDGRVLEELFTAEWLAAHPVQRTGSSLEAGAVAGETYGAAEEKEIMGRLSDLGYLG